MTSFFVGKSENFIDVKKIPQVRAGDLDGRIVVHWSYYVQIASAIIETVTALGALIINQVGFGIVQSVTCCAMYLSAFYLKKFSLAQTMEKDIEKLIEENESLNNQIDVQSKIISQLKEIRQGFLEGLKEREIQLKEVFSQLEKTESAKKEFEKNLTEKLQKLEKLNQKFQSQIDELKQEKELLELKIEEFTSEGDQLTKDLNIQQKNNLKLISDNKKLFEDYENVIAKIEDNSQLTMQVNALSKRIEGLLKEADPSVL